MEQTPITEKTRIFYSRTYRRLSFSGKAGLIYLLLLILPAMAVILAGYGRFTGLVSAVSLEVLNQALPALEAGSKPVAIMPWVEPMTMVTLETVLPSRQFLVLNLVAAAGGLAVLWGFPWRSRPLSIFLSIQILIHSISCLYFYLTPGTYPYSASDYSELYLRQQLGVLLFFLLLSGFLTLFPEPGTMLLRLGTVALILGYALVFGTVRYVVFLYILGRFSVLYMPAMFFTLGPVLDYLYLVALYGFYLYRLIKKNESPQGKRRWVWS